MHSQTINQCPATSARPKSFQRLNALFTRFGESDLLVHAILGVGDSHIFSGRAASQDRMNQETS